MRKSRTVAIVICVITVISLLPINANAISDMELKGYSIGISDGIYLRYHIQMSEASYNGGGYIRFTKSNGEVTEIEISDVEKDAESGYYVYSCEVAAAEMTERITAILYSENGIIEKGFGSYSVREYADNILNGNEYSIEAKETVKAMLNYGAYAQIYFENTENGLANEGIEDNVQDFKDFDEGTYYSYGNFGGLRYVSTALELCSKTVMYHYFEYDDSVDLSSLSFKFDNKVVTPTLEEKNGVKRCCFKSEGIVPTRLWIGIIFLVHDTANNQYSSLRYSPTYYLHLVVTTIKNNDSLIDLAKAMYLYSYAIEAYSNSIA